VKAEIVGFPALNYPNVNCSKEASQNFVFCLTHCDVAREEKIPTGLREFLHDYCGVPRNTKEGIIVYNSLTANYIIVMHEL
jgi:hypothetical protein